ncbi:hypothetical protein O181_021846 [Austropuccinia psidii MF-1]|uniref:P-loop containing nucleoside triphosphate hydrolase protein n=1 Tax=Austropuccinia psidii MF-1 TaxID=1389203 RepID=A0A9Q3CBR3_9BASI|nr:hypothetical protein [Austropuccinia psidii MF-1]
MALFRNLIHSSQSWIILFGRQQLSAIHLTPSGRLYPPSRIQSSRCRRAYSLSNDLKDHPLPNRIEHRPYQQDCLNSCLNALDRGISRIGVSLPTGSGKTTVFINLIHAIPSNHESSQKGWRSIIIVNSIELAHQALNQLFHLFPQTSVSLEQGSHYASEHTKVIIATYQSLNSKQRYKRFEPSEFKCVIVDEAHHALSASYVQILSHFNHFGPTPGTQPEATKSPNYQVPIIGFSATFSRHDRLALSTVFEEIVYHYELRDMIQAGWLAPARFTSVKVKMDLSKVGLTNTKDPDYILDRLAEVIDTEPINDLLLSIYLDRAADRKSTLIFTVNIQHMYRLANKFRNAGIDARVIFSGTSSNERKSLLSDFKLSKFPVLVNCAVLTEGADVPNVDCVILARPTRSRTLLTQMIGRGLRKSQATGKTDCLIIDIFGSVERGVLVTPSLQGLDPNQFHDSDLMSGELGEQALTSDENLQLTLPEDPSPQVSVKSLIYTDYESPFRDENPYEDVRDLYRLTRYSWVGCGDAIFVLDLLGYGHLRIQLEEDETRARRYVIYFVRSLERKQMKTNQAGPSRVFAMPQAIGTANEVSDAIKTADAFLEQTTKRSKSLPSSILRSLERRALWRRLPATEQQISIIQRRLGAKFKGESELEKLNKGQAANLLTRLSHGFKGRLERKLKKQISHVKANKKSRGFEIQVGRLSDS